TAVYNCVPVTGSVTGFGETVMVASGPMVTVTDAVPEMPPLVALTVAVYEPGTIPAVKKPDVLIAPPPATMVHVGDDKVMTLPSASLPTATNCCVAVMASVTLG